MKYRKQNIDRSVCRVCGIELTPENAYQRKDTINHLHAYCKTHYLEIQKRRTARLKCSPYLYTVYRGVSAKPFRVYFESLEEKRKFIQDRYVQSSCEHIAKTVSDSDLRRDGCSASFGDPNVCDECGGILRYDSHGFLFCEECGLETIVTPFYRESYTPTMKGHHSWFNTDTENLCMDSFYARAYRKG